MIKLTNTALQVILLGSLLLNPTFSSAQEEEKQAQNEPPKNAKAPVLVPAADYFEQQQGDIKHYLSEVSEVLVGAKSYALLERKSTTPINKGVVLLLPDWHDMISPSEHLAYLAKTLPNLGYSTLSIQPISKPENFPSTALSIAEQREQNKKIIDDYQLQLNALLVAVMEKAMQQQGAILVITAGNNAGFLMSQYSKGTLELPQAMIMLSAYQLTTNADQRFAKELSESDLPILDLYLKYDNFLVEPSIRARKNMAQRNLKVEFRQYKLNNFTTGYYPNESLKKAITGWLSKMGW